MDIITQRGEPYEYREVLDGQASYLYFSVTQIRRVIHDHYALIPEHVLLAAQFRGTLLHTRFWKLLAWRDGLRGFSNTPRLRPYLMARSSP